MDSPENLDNNPIPLPPQLSTDETGVDSQVQTTDFLVKRKFKLPIKLTLGLIFLLITISFGVYLLLKTDKFITGISSNSQRQEKTPETLPLSPAPTVSIIKPNAELPEGWSYFVNKTGEFQIAYPQDWDVEESNVSGDPTTPTLTFSKKLSSNNFSVFMLTETKESNLNDYVNENYTEFNFQDWTGYSIITTEDQTRYDMITVSKTEINDKKYVAAWVSFSTGENDFNADDYLYTFLSTFMLADEDSKPTASTSDIFGWIQYKGTGGYSYYYPPNWHHFEYYQQTSIARNANQGYSNFMVTYDPEDYYESKLERIRKSTWKEVKESNNTINGYSCISFEGIAEGSKTTYYRKNHLLKRKGNVYEIDIWEPIEGNHLDTSKKILSTFKFIEDL